MKVLLIGHNPTSTYECMGKTFISLFSSFSSKEICQLYVYPSLPDANVCSSYYRVTDKNVLKGYFRFFNPKGKEISKEELENAKSTLFENCKDEKIYRNTKNHTPLRELARDLMWKFSHWFNKGLKKWIEREKPTHIFVAPGRAKFLYKIALKISKKYNLPIITYVCDDFYFTNGKKGLFGKIAKSSLNKTIAKLMKKSNAVITISKELERDYNEEFNLPCYTIMTGASVEISKTPQAIEQIDALTYMGNVRCQRYLSLIEIGKAIEKINVESGKNLKLKIYSPEKDKDIISALTSVQSIEFCGYVSGEEYEKAFNDVQVLVFTESFSKEQIDAVKYSISTKIADSLASGKCLFSFASQELASANYLIENDCAVSVTKQEDLVQKLILLIGDEQLRKDKQEKAVLVASNNHDSNKNSQKLYEIISSL